MDAPPAVEGEAVEVEAVEGEPRKRIKVDES
jgi:hypothetical protein